MSCVTKCQTTSLSMTFSIVFFFIGRSRLIYPCVGVFKDWCLAVSSSFVELSYALVFGFEVIFRGFMLELLQFCFSSCRGSCERWALTLAFCFVADSLASWFKALKCIFCNLAKNLSFVSFSLYLDNDELKNCFLCVVSLFKLVQSW